jgi:hypothetical protein
MSERLKQRLKQLKFISSMFSMAMDEFDNVMGPETIQTIFRLIGERQGEAVEKRLKEKYGIDKWTPELFAEKLTNDVIDPAVGTGASEVSIDGNELNVTIKDCPFKRAGIKISNKFYCTYTEGLIETAVKQALGNIEFKSLKLRAVDNCDCSFLMKI